MRKNRLARKVISAFLVFSCQALAAQQDSSSIQFLVPPDSTALGTADGIRVSKEISADGGSIMSEDGRIELIFPAGALQRSENISIQPITNHAPNGTGKAYWFEPSGIEFKKPVQIIFHYSDDEAEICPPQLMYLAIQNKTGKWDFSEYEKVDSVSRTLKGFIHHFSGAANGSKIKLEPDKNLLCVKERTALRIWKYNKTFDFSIVMDFALGQPLLWSVNGKEGGDASVGFVESSMSTSGASRRSVNDAVYIAPDYILPKNPAVVKVDIYSYAIGGRPYKRLSSLKCAINVYDVYSVTVLQKEELRIAMGNELTDSASFLTWVYPDQIVIDNIKNYPPFLTKSSRRGPGSMILYTKGADGLIHLTEGYKDLKISKDKPPEILFRFLPSYEKLICRFSWVCPGVKTDVDDLIAEQLAPEINFIANGNKQTINVNDNGGLYKVMIVPYRPKNY